VPLVCVSAMFFYSEWNESHSRATRNP
jgi:hypothetical protein